MADVDEKCFENHLSYLVARFIAKFALLMHRSNSIVPAVVLRRDLSDTVDQKSPMQITFNTASNVSNRNVRDWLG